MGGFRPTAHDMATPLRIAVDVGTAALLGVLGLLSDESIYGGPNKRGFFRNDQSISFPMNDDGELVSTSMLIVYCFLVPLILLPVADILAMRDGSVKYQRASRGDVCRAVTLRVATFVMGMGLTVFLTAISKDTVGSLRPDFLARCQPDYSGIPDNQTWIPGSMDICRGDLSVVTKGRRSFPSGHSSVSFYGWIYMALFVQAAVPNHRRCCTYLLTVLQLPMVAVAFLITASRTVDHVHRPADVIAGAILGTAIACYCVLVVLRPHRVRKEDYAKARTDSDGAQKTGPVTHNPGGDLEMAGVDATPHIA